MYRRGNAWYADYYDADGKRQRQSFPTEALALDFEAKAKRRSINTRLKNQKAASVSPTCSGHTTSVKRGQPKLPFAREIAAKALVAEAGSLTASELTVNHLTRTYAAILHSDYAATTRYTALSGLKQLLGQLVASGAPYQLLGVMPRPTRPAPRPNVVTPDELDYILTNAEPYMQLYVLLCHDTALRAKTAANVGWQHLTGDHSLVTIRTKRENVVRIPVSGRIKSLLEMCPSGNLPLVSLMFGKYELSRIHVPHLGYQALYVRYKALLVKLGLPPSLWLHDLRRSMAEKTYNIAGDLRVVQTLLGHDNLSSTLHYLQRPAQTHMDALSASIETITTAKGRFPE